MTRVQTLRTHIIRLWTRTQPPTLRTLDDIQTHCKRVVLRAEPDELGTFWVRATHLNVRTRFQMAGEFGDPRAVIVDRAPIRA